MDARYVLLVAVHRRRFKQFADFGHSTAESGDGVFTSREDWRAKCSSTMLTSQVKRRISDTTLEGTARI
jgi:hypothetical protein